MVGGHDITFCVGTHVPCPMKEQCYRYKEVDRIKVGEVFSTATLYNFACTKDNDYLLFIKDEESSNEN